MAKNPPRKIAVITVLFPKPMVMSNTGTQAIVGTEISILRIGMSISLNVLRAARSIPTAIPRPAASKYPIVSLYRLRDK
jgi:hypothetical protein